MKNVLFASGTLQNFITQITVDERPAHVIVCGTKPDLIKQAPILHELLKRGEKAFLLHTGQHYDENLSGGIEKEFGLKVDVNLKVAGGTLTDVIGKIIIRWGAICSAIKEINPSIQILPYVHGDTTTCFAVTTASFAHGYPTVHVEAGIRTLMIKPQILGTYVKDYNSGFDFKTWLDISSNLSNYNGGSHEPFPEQWNTRATEAGTGLWMSSVDLSTENLKNEGFPSNRVFTVGNSVVDAMDFTTEIQSDIFEQYPALADGFVRVCIHRRENTESQERFTAMFEMIEALVISDKLNTNGKQIPLLMILLPGTKSAIARHGLSDRLEKLRMSENIIISDVWPKYSDVMAAMQRCKLCATDSGSMQEEMNMMGIPTATLRYGSDRPETFPARSNILCPPVSAEFMTEIISGALENLGLFEYPKLYGEKVSEKIVTAVLKSIEKSGGLMRLKP